MATRLEKHTVCAYCHSVGIIYNDCICTYQNGYPTIELEFEVCECCNNIVNDGQCADTPFNDEQLEKK